MMKFIYLLIPVLLLSFFARSQTVSGVVVDEKQRPLVGATIVEEGTLNGVITNVDGGFVLQVSSGGRKIMVSYTGFITDTIDVVLDKEAGIPNKRLIVLKEKTSQLEEVVVQATSTFMDDLQPKHVEVITAKELTKAACCNLSESFETNASVDVSFTDAISGAKTIRMLGLDGRYVQINRESIPNIRGLNSRYGLSYIPGTWVQSIDVGKGAGTVINGYESMTGQINVQLKKPEGNEKLYLNSYLNSFGRAELNANRSILINDKWSTSFLLHTDYLTTEIDHNEDGFLDLPKSKQFNLMNRFKYEGEKMVTQLGITFLEDRKAGGQKGISFGDDLEHSEQYGFLNHTSRLEAFGKTGLLFPHKPYKGWGFIYSASFLDINGGFGRDGYQGKETTLYGNIIFQNIIGNSVHQYKTGASILYDDFDEIYADSSFARKEIVPGLYYEYTFSPNDRFTLLAGARSDFHNLYSTFATFRIHARYQFSKNTTLRAAIGRGYRTSNVLVENSNVLVSSRQLIVEESPEPEVSYNMGGSFVTVIPAGDKKVDVVADYFYTTFDNQLVYDLDKSPKALHVYNLRGVSYAHSFQLEASYSLTDQLRIKGAYKFYDVKTTINDKLRSIPYNAPHRFFINASYATKYDRWKADMTLRWFDAKRLPNTDRKSLAFQRPNASPDFFLVNAQVSRGFRWGSIYLGAENLFNFTQANPIIDPENPFGNDSQFDASIIWGPVIGRMIYAGLRYTVKR